MVISRPARRSRSVGVLSGDCSAQADEQLTVNGGAQVTFLGPQLACRGPQGVRGREQRQRFRDAVNMVYNDLAVSITAANDIVSAAVIDLG